MLLAAIVSINLQPVVSALIEPKEIVLLVLGFLFTIYLLLRGDQLWRATCGVRVAPAQRFLFVLTLHPP
jgi:hypothetical protein